MERLQPRSLTHLGNVHHVCHESKAFQFQLRDEGLEEHIDLGKEIREGLSASWVSPVPALVPEGSDTRQDRSGQWG